MDGKRLAYLLDQYSRDLATAAESLELWDFIRNNQDPELFSGIVADLMERNPAEASELAAYTAIADKVLQIDRDDPAVKVVALPADRPIPRNVHFLRKWGWAAASVLLLCCIGTYLQVRHSREEMLRKAYCSHLKQDFGPGKDGAVLTLANGEKVVLDSLHNGVIATQNGTQVLLKNGQLTYDMTEGATGDIAYNTMSTPKGRQFHLQLPDGTQVWLNSASSIRYPTAFTGKERKVAVTGETYFEVAKNAKMPFKVEVNDREEIEVLGTQFNVNAFENEASLNTTLLEGSLRVRPGQPTQATMGGVLLQPGQQARITAGLLSSDRGAGPPQQIRVINDADIDKVMAWKNGLFNFNEATLEEVMKQLERWYDIEVVYEKGIPDIQFFGKMTKNISLSDLLTILEKSKVHFRIEDRKLIVLP